MGINIRGRSFLTLLDFTPEEINYLLDLSAESRRPPPAPAAPSKWAPATWAWA